MAETGESGGGFFSSIGDAISDAWGFVSDAISDGASFISEQVYEPVQNFVGKGFESFGDTVIEAGREFGESFLTGLGGEVAAIVDLVTPGTPGTDLLRNVGGWLGSQIAESGVNLFGYGLEGLGFDVNPVGMPYIPASGTSNLNAAEAGEQVGRFGGELLVNKGRRAWEDRLRKTRVGARLTGERPTQQSRKGGIRRGTPFYGTRNRTESSAVVNQPKVVYH
jgi:hypothetical protein